MRWFLATILLLLGSLANGQDQLDLPGEVSQWFVNTDGSCVQCSISNCGVWQNDPKASTLLFNTEYGNRVRGGSGPSRVEGYAEKRGIALYNVTGSNTYDWMKWAARTGRMAAIGCFSAHFQTELWYDPNPSNEKPWYVRNNWHGLTDTHYNWTDAEFKKHHRASGNWVVVLKTSSPPPLNVTYVKWW
jgi:hypothetical protein